MFDDHAAHLYDYCLSLLGAEAEAASAARVTLIATYKLAGGMTQPGRLRAWMFALGRRECFSESPIRREPWAGADRPRPARLTGSNGAGAALADAETGEFARIDPDEPALTGFEAEIRRAVQLASRPDPFRPSEPADAREPDRPDEYGEVLDLVQRHGIAAAELPAILDLPAEDAQDLFAAAPAMVPLGSRAQLEPLAAMPATLWRDTASVVFDPEQASLCDAIAADAGRLWADGFPEEPAEIMPPSHKRMAMTSVGLAAALLAPAALGAGLYAAFAASPHSVTRSHDYAIAPPQGTQPATSGSGTSAPSTGTGGRTHHKGRQPITSIFPIFPTAPTSAPPVIVTTPTPKPKQTTPTTHKSSPPVIKSGPPSVTPSPSPTSPSPTSASPTPTPTPTSPTPSQSSLPTNEGTSPSPTSSTSSSNPPLVTPSPSDPSPSG
jgi:DNA-directed RNA polymerase specialized sigma24 family protein